MKKNFKAALTVLFAAVLAFNFIPAKAYAAADNLAFLSYADSSWTYQWWGTGDANNSEGVVATEVTVTGVGTYTVGLDFTGTADGKASGLAFTAPQIAAGETNFPGYFMVVDSIQINGADIEFTKGYTSSDDAIATRTNIYNSWVGDLPEDARTLDGDLSDASAVVVNPDDFAEVQTITVTFTLYDADGNGPAAAAEETTEAAPADVPKTGVIGLGIVYGLGALATGAFALKRKQK
jgi:hypothetical protein